MVRKILNFLYYETQTLNHAAFLLGFFAFLSQLLAFLRDRLLAHFFGASSSLDIYYAAFRIPDFIFVTVASIVSLSVLVPFIIEKEGEGTPAIRAFVNNIFSFFALLIVSVSLLTFFLMPTLSRILFKGFSPSDLSEVILISRLLLLSPIFLGFSNLFGSLTQAYNRFTVYALAPLLYNAGIIVGIIFLTGKLGVMGVVVGVVIGALLHALIQVPFVMALGLFPKLSLSLNLSAIKRVVAISIPRTLTLSMTNMATLFLISFASLMTAGSISVLSFALNLQSVPLSIVGVSYSLAAFPTLSRYFKERNIEAFVKQMATTTRFIIFWSLPMTALFIVLRAQIVRVVLGSGRFDWNATRLTAAALALFALSSLAQCLLILFMRGFYSAGHTRKPFSINLLSTLVLFATAWVLVKVFYFSPEFRYFVSALLKVEDLPSTAVLMLPLAFSLGTIFNVILHWLSFEREFRGFSRQVHHTLFVSLGTSIIMGTVAYLGLNFFAHVFNTTTLLGIFLQGLFAGILGIIVGVVLLMALDSRELAEVWQSLHGRFWKSKVIATDSEIV